MRHIVPDVKQHVAVLAAKKCGMIPSSNFFAKKPTKGIDKILTSDIIIIVDNILKKSSGAMKRNLMEIIMNPTRQRLLQYLAVHGQGSTGEICKELTDIPAPSLYRHARLLLDAKLIEVVKEERIRGAVERTYRLAQNQDNGMKNQDIGAMFQTGLISLMTGFQKYFAQEENDPARDMLTFSTATLMMTDGEFMDFLMRLNTLFGEALQNKPADLRKPRRITLISSPNEDEKKDKE